MKRKRVRNLSRALRSPLDVDYCERFGCRLRGLTWRRGLAEGEGLVLAQPSESRLGSAIHMLGMRFDLAIIWLDANLKVVDARPARRWRSFLMPRRAARFVIECSLSRLDEFAVGEQIALEDA